MSQQRKRVVVIGSGGREAALAWALSREADVIVTPGRAGIPGSVNTLPEELEADLFVVGPETPLVDGLADRLRAQGKLVLGPGARGAQLEGSKAYMKDVLYCANVPTADYGVYSDIGLATGFIDSRPWDCSVVKTSGLAAGKGVTVTASRQEAIEDARAKLSGEAFGDAGRTVVIERGHIGPELSVIALLDGTEGGIQLFPSSRDYKRLLDGDKGPMTGGMGAYAPVADRPKQRYLHELFVRIVHELRRRNIDYRGFMYLGMMLTDTGPIVLEINVRHGDPEAEVVLPLTKPGLLKCFMQAAAGQLTGQMEFTYGAAVTVALAAAGYPDSAKVAEQKGKLIHGLNKAADQAETLGATIFHAGTKHSADGWYEVDGGRVIYVTGTGQTVEQARSNAYQVISLIAWSGIQYRGDIAAIG